MTDEIDKPPAPKPKVTYVLSCGPGGCRANYVYEYPKAEPLKLAPPVQPPKRP